MVDLKKLERLFGLLMAQVSQGENADEETLGLLFEELYDGAVKDYRPLLAAIPQLTGKIANDAGPLIAAIIKLINDIGENPQLQEEVARFRALKAQNRFKNVKAHKDAGFSHQDALAFALIDAAKQSPMAQVPNNLAKGSAKSKE